MLKSLKISEFKELLLNDEKIKQLLSQDESKDIEIFVINFSNKIEKITLNEEIIDDYLYGSLNYFRIQALE